MSTPPACISYEVYMPWLAEPAAIDLTSCLKPLHNCRIVVGQPDAPRGAVTAVVHAADGDLRHL